MLIYQISWIASELSFVRHILVIILFPGGVVDFRIGFVALVHAAPASLCMFFDRHFNAMGYYFELWPNVLGHGFVLY